MGCCREVTAACVSLIVLIVVLLAIGAGVIYYKTKKNPVDFFVYQDPPGLNKTNYWNTHGVGYLKLEMINSCDDKYVPAFNEYVDRWNNGPPDVLNLTSKRVTPDPSCKVYDGKVNVCNSNFGKTDWRGITATFIVSDYIIHAVAKMNDYFLDSEGEIWRRYTMCHEMGHSFGLPHTDENYYNIDRGDCLDYTLRPRDNLSPGTYNFDLLQQMYGPLSTRNASVLNNQGFIDSGGGAYKNLFDLAAQNTTTSSGSNSGSGSNRKLVISDDVRRKYEIALQSIELSDLDALMDWDMKILRRGQHNEEFDVSLGDGFRLTVHKLLVIN